MSGANASPTGRSNQGMSGANASPAGRSNQGMSGANASPIGRSNQEMSGPVIFKDLPATFPEKDKYRKPSVLGSVLFHGLLIFLVIVMPVLIPQSIPER